MLNLPYLSQTTTKLPFKISMYGDYFDIPFYLGYSLKNASYSGMQQQ
jgi:hypothetical protein